LRVSAVSAEEFTQLSLARRKAIRGPESVWTQTGGYLEFRPPESGIAGLRRVPASPFDPIAKRRRQIPRSRSIPRRSRFDVRKESDP